MTRRSLKNRSAARVACEFFTPKIWTLTTLRGYYLKETRSETLRGFRGNFVDFDADIVLGAFSGAYRASPYAMDSVRWMRSSEPGDK